MNKKYIFLLLAIILVIVVVFTGNKKENNETKDLVSENTVTNPSKPSVQKPTINNTSTPPNQQPPSSKPSVSSVTVKNLEGKVFRLTSFNGLPVANDSNYTISFTNDSLNAKFCNNLSGLFVLDSGIIKSSNLISTQMYCGIPANLMDIEKSFVSILNFGANIIRVENGIMLSGPKGSIFVFTGFVN